ncbi:hypothetical protein JTB14_015610 [Gonioctena quinquepunctata]|nr:hypothetical protein JTB14_015610 [Gonioctena quinquepunctata]
MGYSIMCQKCLEWLHRDCAALAIEEVKQFSEELKDPNGKRYHCMLCTGTVSKKTNAATSTANFSRRLSCSDESNNDKLLQQAYMDESGKPCKKCKEENANLPKNMRR